MNPVNSGLAFLKQQVKMNLSPLGQFSQVPGDNYIKLRHHHKSELLFTLNASCAINEGNGTTSNWQTAIFQWP